MPDRPTVTVDIDGEAREVELPDGFLSEDQVREQFMPKDMFRAELSKQVREKTQGKRAPDELVEDDDFLDTVIERRKDDLLERLGVKPQDREQDLEKLTRQIEEQRVKPIESQLEQVTSERDRLRIRALDAEVGDAADALEVEDDLRDLVRLWVREKVTYDEDHGWIVTDSDGEPDFVVEDGKPRPKGVRHLLDEVKKSGEKKGWFRATTRDGIGYRGHEGGRTPSKRPSEMSEAEKVAFIDEHGLPAWQKALKDDRRRRKSA